MDGRTDERQTDEPQTVDRQTNEQQTNERQTDERQNDALACESARRCGGRKIVGKGKFGKFGSKQNLTEKWRKTDLIRDSQSQN